MDKAQSQAQTSSTPTEKPNRQCRPLYCQYICCTVSQRLNFAILMHLAFQCAYNLRVVLNVAIVEMVEPNNISNSACPEYFIEDLVKGDYGKTYNWPKNTQAMVLYSFYIGYTVSQIPGGIISDKFGGRWVLFATLAISVCVTVLLPICLHVTGYWVVVLLRTILGLAQGPMVPAMATLISKWIPPEERALLGGLAYSGSNLGTVLGNLVTGSITKAFGSWHAPFYFWSAWCTVYLFLNFIWVYSYPHSSPYVSKEEVEYLEKNVVIKKTPKVPWKKIFKNVPFWANCAGHFGHNYIFYLMITYLPTYMREVLGYDIHMIAMLSAIPFILLWITSLVYNAIAKYIEAKITKDWYNRIFGPFSNIGSALCLLGAGYIGCNRLWVMILYTLSMCIKPFGYSTFTINVNDLSNHFSGVIMAIINAISTIGGVLGNFLVGQITTHGSLEQWQLVYWICLGVCVFTSLIYAFFFSSKRQSFDFLSEEEIE